MEPAAAGHKAERRLRVPGKTPQSISMLQELRLCLLFSVSGTCRAGGFAYSLLAITTVAIFAQHCSFGLGAS